MHGDEVRGSKPSFSFSEAEFFLVDLNSVAEPFQKPLQPLRVGGRHRKHGVAGEVIFFFSVAAWSPTVPGICRHWIAAIPACFSFSMSVNAIAPAEFSSPRLSDRVVKLSNMTSLTPVPTRSWTR
jgi:hypothetical protein